MSTTIRWYEDSDSDERGAARREVQRPSAPQRSSQTQRSKKNASGYNGIHRRRNKRWSW